MATAKKVATNAKKEGAVADIFEQNAGRRFDIDQDDKSIPFIKVLTAEMADDYDAKGGDILHTSTGQIYKGSEGIYVIPIAYERVFIHWQDRQLSDTKAPVRIYKKNERLPETFRSEDPSDFKDYISGGQKKDYLEDTRQWYVMVYDEENGCNAGMIAMKSTQLKKSKAWMDLCESRRKKTADGKLYAAPYWSHLYCLKTKQVTREPNQRWYEWLPALHRAMSDEGTDLPIIEECIHYENMFFEGQIEVKYEEENDGELVEDAGPGF